MVCPRAVWVEKFVAGVLDEGAVPALEAHIEECQECFLRIVAAAGDASEEQRASFATPPTVGSRLDRCVRGASNTRSDARQASSSSSDWSPKTIGPYVVTGFLGAGGMGVVYRAKHRPSGREVAVKTVKMPVRASYLATLRQEIEFLRDARHAAIVAVLDYDLLADEPWYAMELYEGRTLEDFVRQTWRLGSAASGAAGPAAGGRLPEALRLFAALCDPVGFIHGAGMIHGDIKPSNVFLRADQTPVLMDFGLVSRAKGTVGRETLDVTGRIRGTLPYLAPEIIRGQLPDARADLYALGCMLYEIVVGEPPFASENAQRIIDMQLGTAPTPASQRVAGVPAQLDQLLLRLLAKNPADRFGHASALGTSLLSIAEALSVPSAAKPRAVVSSEAMPLFRPPIVGRDSELMLVLDCILNVARPSSGSMFLISGESGIGKTFFTAEVAQRALLGGAHVVTSECVPLAPASSVVSDAGTTPLQGFTRLFESLRDRCQERGQLEIDRLFGDRLPVLIHHLPILKRFQRTLGAPEAPPPLPASAARERIVTAVVDTVAAYAAGHRLVLAMDDLQWADELTLAVLERLDDLFGRVPLVVIGTYRSDETTEAIVRLARKPSTCELRLGRFGRQDVRGMVAGMLSMPMPPDPLVDYVHLQAEGVPFYGAEYLRTLVAAGALVYQAGAWSASVSTIESLGASEEGRLSPTLQDLIRGRLQRLAPSVVEVLEAAAVLGRRFSISLLGRMMERSENELVALLATAVSAQIANTDGVDGYTFLHDKIRETLFAGLPAPRRVELHLDAARALEEGPATPPDHYGQIGHHLRHGGRAAKAVDYFEKAGIHALGMAANAEADRFFREAIALEATLAPRLPPLRRARWLRQRADALSGLGSMAESAVALKASAALLGRPFPRSRVGFAVKLAREVLAQLWHRLRPRRTGRVRAARVEVDREVAHVFERMHEVAFYLSRDADLVLSTTVSLNASERIGATPSLPVAYSNAAMMAGVLTLGKLAELYFRLAAAAIVEAPDTSAESWLMEMEGHFCLWQGRRKRSIECLERASALALQGGFFRRRDEAECVLTGVDVFAGFHRAGLARAVVVERDARKRRDVQVQCWAILQQVHALAIRGDFKTGLAEVARARSLLPSLARPEEIWATGLEAYLRQRVGDREAAAKLLEAGLGLALAGPALHSHCIDPCDRMVELALEACSEPSPPRDLRARLRTARRALTVINRTARVFPIARPAAALHRGTLDLILGRAPGPVVQRWRAAIQLSRELVLPIHELRLQRAVLACAGGHDQPAADRIRELELVLELAPRRLATPPQFGLLGGGVEVEGEGQQPHA